MPFDPNGAVRFDIKTGSAADSRGVRHVLMPAAALEALERTTPGALAHLGSEIGKSCGARVATALGGDAQVRAGALEAVVTHLAGELAIAGLGAAHLERWGKALVIVLNNPGVQSDGFNAAVLSGALGMAAGREVAIAPLGKDKDSDANANVSRFLVCTQNTAIKIRSQISQGKSWSDILASLKVPS